MDADLRRKINRGLSIKMKAIAERRRCPSCGRKGGLVPYPVEEIVLRKCRFCGFEKGGLR